MSQTYEIAILTNRQRIKTPTGNVLPTLFVDSIGDFKNKQVVLPESIKGNMGKMKNFILDYYKQLGTRYLFLIDDDIKGYIVRNKIIKKGKLSYWEYKKLEEPDEFEVMFKYAIDVMQKTGSSIVGIAQEMLMNKGTWYEEYEGPNPCYTTILIDLQKIKSRYDDNCVIWEDFDFCFNELVHCQLGYQIRKYLLIGSPPNRNGGCQSRYKDSQKYIDYVIKKYPVYSRFIKSYSTSGVIRPRALRRRKILELAIKNKKQSTFNFGE